MASTLASREPLTPSTASAALVTEVTVSDGHTDRKVSTMEARDQPRNDAERLNDLLYSLRGDDLLALVQAFADVQREHERGSKI